MIVEHKMTRAEFILRAIIKVEIVDIIEPRLASRYVSIWPMLRLCWCKMGQNDDSENKCAEKPSAARPME